VPDATGRKVEIDVADQRTIGRLLQIAEDQAALCRFPLERTYRSRLAKAIKELLDAEAHQQDVKEAVKRLVRENKSPILLGSLVRERLSGGSSPILPDEVDLDEFAQPKRDPDWLKGED
jgi:hypothetical protein